MTWYRWDGDDLLLTIMLQPRASKDEFVAPQGNAYKVRIAAPPVDGRANEQLLRFFAKAFGVKIANVLLVAGINSRRKAVRILNPTLLPIPVQPLIKPLNSKKYAG